MSKDFWQKIAGVGLLSLADNTFKAYREENKAELQAAHEKEMEEARNLHLIERAKLERVGRQEDTDSGMVDSYGAKMSNKELAEYRATMTEDDEPPISAEEWKRLQETDKNMLVNGEEVTQGTVRTLQEANKNRGLIDADRFSQSQAFLQSEEAKNMPPEERSKRMAEIMNKDEDIRSTWDSDTGKLERIKDIEAKQKALEIQRQELVKAEEKEKDRSWKSEENEKNREAKADSDKKHRELMLALKKSGDSKEKALAIKDLKSDIDKSSAEYEKERTAYNKSIKGTTADMLPEDAKQEYAELENKRLSLEQKAKDYYELTGRAYLPGGLLASDKKQQPGYTNSGSGNELASYMSRIDSNPKIPPQEKQRLKKMAIEAAGKGKY